jgi:hypothetical protein
MRHMLRESVRAQPPASDTQGPQGLSCQRFVDLEDLLPSILRQRAPLLAEQFALAARE